MKKNKKIIIILSSIFSFIALLIISMFIYLSIGIYKADINIDVLKSNEIVEVIVDDDYITFIPKEYENGLIFYQGAKVDELAYVPMIKEIASNNILCVIPKFSWDLALFDMNVADEIISNYDNDIKWYISGHSLGGAMASSYASKNINKLEGVILFASYSTKDISDLRVLSIYGSNDLVLNKEKYQDSKKNYPSNFKEVIINGGNHANFAYYGNQKGDGEAKINKDEQINISVNEVLSFINV